MSEPEANTSSFLQMRPKYDELSYAPHRDIAWLFPMMAEAARQSLEKEHLEPWLVQFLGLHGIGEKELADAYLCYATALADSVRLVMYHPSCPLDAANFFAAPPAAKLAVFARVGLAATSFFHRFVRESTVTPRDADIHARNLAYIHGKAEEFLRMAKERNR